MNNNIHFVHQNIFEKSTQECGVGIWFSKEENQKKKEEEKDYLTKGSLLLCEGSFAHGLFEEFKDRMCHSCLDSISSSSSSSYSSSDTWINYCERCHQVFYCSEECKTRDRKQHGEMRLSLTTSNTECEYLEMSQRIISTMERTSTRFDDSPYEVKERVVEPSLSECSRDLRFVARVLSSLTLYDKEEGEEEEYGEGERENEALRRSGRGRGRRKVFMNLESNRKNLLLSKDSQVLKLLELHRLILGNLTSSTSSPSPSCSSSPSSLSPSTSTFSSDSPLFTVLLEGEDEFLEVACILRCNSFSLFDSREGHEVGSVLFLQASRFNHSCAPNCIATISKSPNHFASSHSPSSPSSSSSSSSSSKVFIQIRTLVNIPSLLHKVLRPSSGRNEQFEEELCITYIELDLPLLDRKAKLRTSHCFDCNCPRCSLSSRSSSSSSPSCEDFPVIEKHLQSILCEVCGGWVIPRKEQGFESCNSCFLTKDFLPEENR